MSFAGQREHNRSQVVLLRSQGLKYREIADRTGLSKSYIGDLVHDGTGKDSRDRKLRLYGRPCQSCGKQTNPGGRNAGFTHKCAGCIKREQRERVHSEILAAMQEWNRLYGRPPRSYEWSPRNAERLGKPEVAALHRAGNWPHATTVQAVFGSWNNALREAGLTPSKHGGNNHGPYSVTEDDRTKTARLHRELGVVGAAQALGITPGGVYQRIKQGGTTVASSVRPITTIEREIERVQARVEVLQSQIKDAQQDLEQLHQAKAILNGKPK